MLELGGEPGEGAGGPAGALSQYFADQLTLILTKGADSAHPLLLALSKFFNFRRHFVVYKNL